jgi:hypothetical protein
MNKLKVDFWMVVSLVLGVVLVASLVSNSLGLNLVNTGGWRELNVKSVSAQEIYPLFFCPCCGKPLDKNNICCEMAQERINFIDSLAAEGKAEKEIILAYVKKYGLNSFVDKNKAEEVKVELVKTAPADRPIISLSPQTYDFGDISLKKGKVFTSFTLKNEGESDLVINKLDTSCGCTFAAIVFEGSQSPFFTMPGHGSENPSWEGVAIPSGKEAELKVMYDPAVHQDFRGPATREIYVYSNDPVDFEKKVTVELDQVD